MSRKRRRKHQGTLKSKASSNLPNRSETNLQLAVPHRKSHGAANGLRSADPAADARRKINVDMVVGLIIAATLICAKIGFEHTKYAEHLSLTTYDYMQSILVDNGTPVVVVDLTGIPWKQSIDGLPITDRSILLDLVNAIVAQSPKGVGIDIDFAPSANKPDGALQFLDPEHDAVFFDRCLASTRDGIPIFLGVNRTREYSAADRLVFPAYGCLAASVLKPSEDNRMMVECIRSSGPDRLQSIGARLGRAYASISNSTDRWPGWFARPGATYGVAGTHSDEVAEDVYVDFSAVGRMMRTRIHWRDVLTGAGNFRGKIVILGMADPSPDEPRDIFVTIAGLTRRSIPGIYAHGALAHTVALDKRLYRLTEHARIAVDLIMSILVLGSVWIYRMIHLRCTDGNEHVERAQDIATNIFIVVAFAAGVLLVSVTRIMWDDFLMVLVALKLHRWAETPIHGFLHRLNSSTTGR